MGVPHGAQARRDRPRVGEARRHANYLVRCQEGVHPLSRQRRALRQRWQTVCLTVWRRRAQPTQSRLISKAERMALADQKNKEMKKEKETRTLAKLERENLKEEALKEKREKKEERERERKEREEEKRERADEREKKKAERDAKALLPKKPLSPYMCFTMARREEVTEELKEKLGDDFKPTEVLKRVAEMWKALDDDAKAEWESAAAADKERYARECEEAGIEVKLPKRKEAAGEKEEAAVEKKKPKLEKAAPEMAHVRAPKSAEQLYRADNRDRVATDNINEDVQGVLRILNEEIAALPAADLAKYEELAAADAERYERELAEARAEYDAAVEAFRAQKGAEKAAKEEEKAAKEAARAAAKAEKEAAKAAKAAAKAAAKGKPKPKGVKAPKPTERKPTETE